MSASTWTVTSTKRKTKSLTPFSRKRARLNDISGKSSSSRRPRNSQQTLTQAQWLTPPPTSFEEGDGQSMNPGALHSPPTTRPRRTLKKRNSTLTQMDFFGFPPPDDADFDDSMVPLVENGVIHPPQLDGTHASPRKQRRRKATSNTTNPSTKRKNAPVAGESQEYTPSTRKGRMESVDNEPLSSRRRTSGRLASRNQVFSDPAQNLAYFEEALGTITPKNSHDDTKLEGALGHPLEMKDMNDADVENDLDGAAAIAASRKLLPHTPNKNKGIVLSSQSPESLPPSTQGAARKTSDLSAHFQRTPLTQRSVNIPFGLMSKLSPRKSRQPSKSAVMKTRKKIVTLKLPKRTQPRRPTCIEDSQTNLWSIPSSSSPRQENKRIVRPRAQAHEPLHLERQHVDAEIPATSQARNLQSSPPDFTTQDTLPDISELIGGNEPKARKGRQAQDSRERVDFSVSDAVTAPILREFAGSPTGVGNLDAHTPDCVNRFPAESVTALQDGSSSPEHDDMGIDVDDNDFGSPIANDTQFNIAVDHRVSSPAPLGFLDQAETTAPSLRRLDHSPTPLPRSLRSPEKVVLSPARARTLASLQNPVPVPRLVQQSPSTSPEKVVLDSEDDSDEMILPKPATLDRSSTHVLMTKVPLNDIGQQSSSPSLPSNKTGTPKSLRPASLPHPSQMSTQEATQGYLNMSSYMPEHTEQESDDYKTERITIKDSSSSHIPMSQLPLYTGESQSQVNIDLGLDEVFTNEEEDEEEGDLDLDPPTSCLHPQSACVSTDAQKLETKTDDLDEHEQPGISQTRAEDMTMDDSESPVRSSQLISIPSSPDPARLQKQYSPIPGFNNETQSNFTQNGHVTAAYVHRQHEAGVLPKWYIPQPYQVPGYTRRK